MILKIQKIGINLVDLKVNRDHQARIKEPKRE